MNNALNTLMDTSEDLGPSSDYPIKLNHYTINGMRRRSPEWRSVENDKGSTFEDYPKAMDTFFSALYKPKASRVEGLTQTGKMLGQLLDAAEQTKEWQQFRKDTMLDEVSSAMGAIHLAKMIDLPEIPERQEGKGESEADLPSVLTDEQMNGIRRQIRKAVTTAQEDIQEQKVMESIMWGTDSGELVVGRDSGERLALAARLKNSPNVKRLLDLVGKFRIIAKTKYEERTIRGRDELVGIKLGDNLRDVVPDELAYLMDEDMEDLFFLNWVEGQLLEYEFRATEHVGQGPIVARIDISGSMGAKITGVNKYNLPVMSKLEWAIATALALAVIAKKEKRTLSIGFFNTTMVKEYTFPGGRITPETILEIASFGTAGGTDFEVPLQDATAKLEESEFDKADVLFLSDGEASVSQSFLDRWEKIKAERGFKAFAVLFHHSRSPVLDRLCDGVVQIASLGEGDKALDMAFTI